ncbi:hypothetical protein ACFP9V_18590 [Deinococcus radiopugnans]|uniref:Uncharacterized protein n=1 Tax=Deinococcus radiopugnans ATCC 19172 TaxID=585398 RepID=A0A5C4YA84_9DEIO|nr:hypothetical protein [Deinococcus radiopugnans]MBB6017434.1 hypothetical protein [Deinococcus radiopugnans ATCC 19172]TNM71966.1 hypothetical protein FHR04_06275 [Deinococcus radiopugnans ATCC 19172]
MTTNNDEPFPSGVESHLRGHLDDMILAGNRHAAVLGRFANGCPVPPAKQAWALGALVTLQEAAFQMACVTAERVEAMRADPVTAILPILQQALAPLMRNPRDLPWASRTVAAALVHWCCPPPSLLVTKEALEDAWHLAPEILPYVRHYISGRELMRSWPEVDQNRWEHTAVNWYYVQDEMEQEAFQSTADYLCIESIGETLHWIASEAARREQHENHCNVCARHAQ